MNKKQQAQLDQQAPTDIYFRHDMIFLPQAESPPELHEEGAFAAMAAYLEQSTSLGTPLRAVAQLHQPIVGVYCRCLRHVAAQMTKLGVGGRWLQLGAGCGVPLLASAQLDATVAEKIYALPAHGSPFLDTTAANLLERHGLRDRVEILRKPVEQVLVDAAAVVGPGQGAEHLPGPALVLVVDPDLFDEGLLGLRVLPYVRHARRALCIPTPLVVPAVARVFCAPVAVVTPLACGFDLSEMDGYRWGPWSFFPCGCFSRTESRRRRGSGSSDGEATRRRRDRGESAATRRRGGRRADGSAERRRRRYEEIDAAGSIQRARGGVTLLAPPQEIFVFDFGADDVDAALPVRARVALDFVANETATLNGVVFWWSLDMVPDETFSESASNAPDFDRRAPPKPAGALQQAIQWVDPVGVAERGAIKIHASHNSTRIRFEVTAPERVTPRARRRSGNSFLPRPWRGRRHGGDAPARATRTDPRARGVRRDPAGASPTRREASSPRGTPEPRRRAAKNRPRRRCTGTPSAAGTSRWSRTSCGTARSATASSWRSPSSKRPRTWRPRRGTDEPRRRARSWTLGRARGSSR